MRDKGIIHTAEELVDPVLCNPFKTSRIVVNVTTLQRTVTRSTNHAHVGSKEATNRAELARR